MRDIFDNGAIIEHTAPKKRSGVGGERTQTKQTWYAKYDRENDVFSLIGDESISFRGWHAFATAHIRHARPDLPDSSCTRQSPKYVVVNYQGEDGKATKCALWKYAPYITATNPPAPSRKKKMVYFLKAHKVPITTENANDEVIDTILKELGWIP